MTTESTQQQTSLNWPKIMRRFSLYSMLTIATLQAFTVSLLAFGVWEILPMHKLCGMLFFCLIILHIIVFRKTLKAILFPPKKA